MSGRSALLCSCDAIIKLLTFAFAQKALLLEATPRRNGSD